MTETRDATATPERGRPTPARKGNPLARLSLFYRQIVAELRKVVWPTRRQLLVYTAVVMVFVLIIIAFVLGIDQVVTRAVDFLYG